MKMTEEDFVDLLESIEHECVACQLHKRVHDMRAVRDGKVVQTYRCTDPLAARAHDGYCFSFVPSQDAIDEAIEEAAYDADPSAYYGVTAGVDYPASLGG